MCSFCARYGRISVPRVCIHVGAHACRVHIPNLRAHVCQSHHDCLPTEDEEKHDLPILGRTAKISHSLRFILGLLLEVYSHVSSDAVLPFASGIYNDRNFIYCNRFLCTMIQIISANKIYARV